MEEFDFLGLPEEQVIYVVEKLEPGECPEIGCGNEFRGGSYKPAFIAFGPREAQKLYESRLSAGEIFVELIVCGSCESVVPLRHLEERVYEYEADAVLACERDGFANLREGKATGSMRVKGMRRSIQEEPPHLQLFEG